MSTVAAIGVVANGASANGYTGLLSGSASVNVPALIGGVPAGSVYDQLSWSAPSGVQFHGFAYTSGSFWVQNFDATGGISAGFKGSGGSAPTDLNFPWTTDCAISEDDSPRTWINSGVSVSSSTKGPGAGTNGYCGTTGGNTSGWDFTNAEVESTNPAVNPQTDYQSLTLSVWCARDAACNNDDSGAASVSNLSGYFDDSYNSPSGSIAWSGGINGSFWVQTNTGNVSISGSASDPAGVCSMQESISGPENVSSGLLGNQNPGVTNVGGAIGTEFQYGTNPCWVGQTDSGSWTLPGGLASGDYVAYLNASNPGNYEAQGMSANGSPEVSSTGSVPIDDTTPSVSLQGATGSGSWTTAAHATIAINTGPSGLSSVTCTDNGAGVGATRTGSNGNSYTYSVPLSAGPNSIACSAANGDQNGALVGSSGTQLYQQDSTVPSIAYSDSGYTQGSWSATQQTVQVTATGGASGVSGLVCTLDGNALPDGNGDTATVGAAGPTQAAFVTVPANGAHDLVCSADNAGTPTIVGSGNYHVDVDSQIPVTSFVAGSGYAATSTHATNPQSASGQNWISGAANVMIGVTGTESTVESGVQTVTCTVNGYTTKQVVLTNDPTSGTVAPSTPFVTTFKADPAYGWIDGQNALACNATTVAGLVGADGASASTSSVEYVDVNDPSLPTSPGVGHGSTPTPGACGISSVIDNGECAYSDGPSQTAWYSTAQTLRIEADDTGAAAPITSIACSGVAMPVSSWTAAADPQDVDGHNGLTVTATIDAPGGKLDCSASDSANPVDTYELGTYNVSIDPSTPSGFFEPQGYQNAAKNIIQLKLKSNPSGIKQVVVQATDENTGVTYTGDQLTTNPADGHTAYATFDQNTGTWNLTVNPGVFPNVNDKIKFVATATTNAGVPGAIATAEDGSAEVVTPGGLGDNPTHVTGYSQTGDGTSIVATARSGHWGAPGTSEQTLPTVLEGTNSNPIAPTLVGTVASWKHSVCKTVAKKHGGAARTSGNRKFAKKAPQRSCRTLTSRAPRSDALPANYGQETEITGTLKDTRTNAPLAGGAVGIYTTNLVTDQVKLVHTETAGPRGNFSYRLAAGPDRRVDLIYLGQWDSYHGADTAFDTTTAGRLRVHSARVARVGQHMRITGKILGGSIQAKGALVQMEYLIAGQRSGWAPFKPGCSNAKGAFVIRFPVSRGSRNLTYRVRIKVPTQAGWGFRGATSNVLRFRVK